MILKSYIVEQNVDVLNEYQGILLYGANDGIKDDIKIQLKEKNKNVEIINFFEAEIIKNRNVLYENIVNESLFNEKKIIFIQLATDKILNEIEDSLNQNKKNVKIYIFSENLDKRSKLRNFFEKTKHLGIMPCYEDNDRTLINYISKELHGFKGLTGELINLIIANSSSNRKIIQGEIVKIKYFFLQKKISKDKLLDLLNIKINSNFDIVRDNMLIGEKNKINKTLSAIDLLSEDSFIFLNSLNQRIVKLIEIQEINQKFNDHEETLNNLKPPIFWKDKPVYLQQLKRWDLNMLNKAAYEIGETEVLMKKNSQIRNDLLIKGLIINLSKQSFTFL